MWSSFLNLTLLPQWCVPIRTALRLLRHCNLQGDQRRGKEILGPVAGQWPQGTRASRPALPGWHALFRLLLHQPPREPDAEDLPWREKAVWRRVAQVGAECEGQPGEAADRLWRGQCRVHRRAEAGHPSRVHVHRQAGGTRSLCVCTLTFRIFTYRKVIFRYPLIWDTTSVSNVVSCFSPGGPPADGGVMWPRAGLFRGLLWALWCGESASFQHGFPALC